MTRRPTGTGTVRTIRKPTGDAAGRYQALGPRLPGGKRISLYCGPDAAEAGRCADEGARQQGAGEALHLTGTTLRAWLERYLDGRERDKPRSVRAERAAAKHVLGPLTSAPWADDPIDTIGTPAIDEHLVALARRLPGMAKAAKALLSGAFRRAGRKGLVIGNPVSAVELPEVTRTHEPWTWLTAEEQAALLGAPAGEPERLLVTVWLYTGLRSGEILSLRIADVHLARAEIVVRHGSLHGPPKGRRICTVHLFPPALAALRRWLTVLPAYLGRRANSHGLVFPGPRGGSRSTSDPFLHCGTWEGVLEAAGILRRVGADALLSAAHRHDGQVPREHDAFRHSCGAALASGMWTAEPWTTAQIQAHLRHSSQRETERYAHLAPSVVRAKAAQVRGVGYAMEHGEGAIRHDSRDIGAQAWSTAGCQGRAAPAARGAPHAPSVTHQVGEALAKVDGALAACTARDPHAGRRAVEALGVAREALVAVLAEAAAAPTQRASDGRGRP